MKTRLAVGILVAVLGGALPRLRAVEYLWTGAVSSDWSNPGNWNPAGVPGLGDTARLPAGRVRTGGAVEVDRLVLSGGTVTCDGSLTVLVAMSWSTGEMQGPGKLVIPVGAELELAGDSMRGMVGLTVETAGTTRWTGGGGISVGGQHTVWSNTGVLEVLGNGQVSNGGSGGTLRVVNEGTLRKASPGGTSGWYNTSLENRGLLDLESGSILMGGLFQNFSNCVVRVGSLRPDVGGANAGTLELRTGALLELTGAVFTNRAGAMIVGAGTTRVTGRLRVEGAGTVESVEMVGGTVDCAGQLTVSRKYWAGSGTISGPGKLVIPAGAELELAGDSARGMVGLTVETAGTTRWTGGGGINVGGQHTVWTNTGCLEVLGNGQVSNGGSGGTLRVVNEGTLRKATPGGTSGWYNTSLESRGLLDLESGSLLMGGLFQNFSNCVVRVGSLRPDAGGANEGTMELRTGALLELTGPVFTNRAGAMISGEGTTRVTGRLRVEGSGTVESLEMVGGTVDCAGQLTVSRKYWAGSGTIAGPGKLVIPGGAELELAGDSSRVLAGLTVETAGTTRWTGGGGINVGGQHTVWRNTGVWEVLGTGRVSNGGSGGTLRVVNEGTLRKAGSAGGASFLVTRLENLGRLEVDTGILEFSSDPLVQTAGVTWLAGGTLKSDGGVDIRAGRLGGWGTVSGPVTCGGQLEPGDPVGTLQVVGDLQLLDGAGLTMELAGTDPVGGFDRLVVSGRATLRGQLNARLAGGFVPGFNSRFGILACGTRTGTFTTFVADPLGPGNFLTPEYLAAGVNLLTLDAAPTFVVGPVPLAGGPFSFRMTGIAGQRYVVEATTNLWGVIPWEPVATNVVAGSGVWEFVDPETALYAHRFFRALHAP